MDERLELREFIMTNIPGEDVQEADYVEEKKDKDPHSKRKIAGAAIGVAGGVGAYGTGRAMSKMPKTAAGRAVLKAQMKAAKLAGGPKHVQAFKGVYRKMAKAGKIGGAVGAGVSAAYLGKKAYDAIKAKKAAKAGK